MAKIKPSQGKKEKKHFRNGEATKVAIDPFRNPHFLTPMGLESLQELHKKMNIKGWVYGDADDTKKLQTGVVTPAEAKNMKEEMKAIREQLAESELARKKAEEALKSKNSGTGGEVKKEVVKKEVVKDAAKASGTGKMQDPAGVTNK